MAQDKSGMVLSTDVVLPDGRVKPFDKVQVEWKEQKFLGKKGGELEFVHPLLAEKLVKKGLVIEPTAEAKEAAAKKAAPKAVK